MSGTQNGGGRDYYEVLGARQDASAEEIERLYKRLAVRHHPDRGGDEEEMKTLNEAYRTLGNKTARNAYDAARTAGEPPRAAPQRADDDDDDVPLRPVRTSPGAQADVFGGRAAGSALCIALGLVLLLLVRFQYMWFLFPLALLALFMVLVGVLMAHATMRLARERAAPTHPLRRLVWAQETLFWSLVGGGVYGVYLLMV